MVEIILTIATVLIMAAILLAVIRFAIGPFSVDRVVSFDTITIASISLIILIAHSTGRVIYLDVAFVYGLLSFIGVVVFARYFEKGL